MFKSVGIFLYSSSARVVWILAPAWVDLNLESCEAFQRLGHFLKLYLLRARQDDRKS